MRETEEKSEVKKTILEKIGGIFVKIYRTNKRRNHYFKLRRQLRMELHSMYKSMNATSKRDENKGIERLDYPKSLETFEIIKVQARRNDSEIMFAPVSGEFVIKVGEENYIIMTANKASVINGIYHYDVRMPQDATWYLSKYLKRIVERRRRKIITEIESRVGNSLDKILKEAKNSFKEVKKSEILESQSQPEVLEETEASDEFNQIVKNG